MDERWKRRKNTKEEIQKTNYQAISAVQGSKYDKYTAISEVTQGSASRQLLRTLSANFGMKGPDLQFATLYWEGGVLLISTLLPWQWGSHLEYYLQEQSPVFRSFKTVKYRQVWRIVTRQGRLSCHLRQTSGIICWLSSCTLDILHCQ